MTAGCVSLLNTQSGWGQYSWHVQMSLRNLFSLMSKREMGGKDESNFHPAEFRFIIMLYNFIHVIILL